MVVVLIATISTDLMKKVSNIISFQTEKIIYNALSSPFIQILDNAGYSNPTWYMYELGNTALENTWLGYDLKSETIVNMLDAGILDPTKVVRLAIENAASVAGTILTTETVIYEEPTKEKKEDDFGNPGLGF